MLLGDRGIEPMVDHNLLGTIEAVAFRARRGGTATAITVYLDARDRATSLFAGLYSSRNARPQFLLTSGSLRSPKPGAWNSVPVNSANLRSGRTYWLAVLGNGGAVYFRDRNLRSCTSSGFSKQTSRSLPRTWSGGLRSHLCTISAYLKGVAYGTRVFGINGPGGTPPVGPVSSGGGNGGGGAGGGGGVSGVGGCANATNHPAAFASNCDTGYTKAPGYLGQLTTCSTSIQSNATYQFCNYPNGLTIGGGSDHPTNVTFIGCRFASNSQADADVADYGSNVTFSYSTFEPSAVSSPPVGHTQGYQYAIDQRYTGGGFTVDHSDFWGWANGIQIDHSSQSTPVSVTYSWFHDARADGGVDHTDAILENYGDPGVDYMTFSHNTIASAGNTNGLALQDGNGGGYDHLTVTGNYFAGFGYTVNLGGSGPVTNTQFTGNVFGSDFPIAFGPLYGGHWTTGNGNTWAGNTYYIFPGTTWLNAAITGRYWWPTDVFGTNNGQNPATFAAHTTDYTG